MKTNYYVYIIPLFIMAIGLISQPVYQILAQSTHSEADSTPINAVIIITTGEQGQPVYSPQKIEIRQGDEILIVNNVTQPQTFTNGNGTGDQMDGKIFSVEIAPDSFAEYLASNISPGNYTFYSENDPNLKGELVVSP
jgi:plastocyanin